MGGQRVGRVAFRRNHGLIHVAGTDQEIIDPPLGGLEETGNFLAEITQVFEIELERREDLAQRRQGMFITNRLTAGLCATPTGQCHHQWSRGIAARQAEHLADTGEPIGRIGERVV